MPNPRYVAGRKKEYAICNELRETGLFEIIQRTAGSHSPIDIIAVSRQLHQIYFIQSKPEDYKGKGKLEKEMEWLNGKFEVGFCVR